MYDSSSRTKLKLSLCMPRRRMGKWRFSLTLRPLCSRWRGSGTPSIAGCVIVKASLGNLDKRSVRESNHDWAVFRSTAQSLYWLSYRSPHYRTSCSYNCVHLSVWYFMHVFNVWLTECFITQLFTSQKKIYPLPASAFLNSVHSDS